MIISPLNRYEEQWHTLSTCFGPCTELNAYVHYLIDPSWQPYEVQAFLFLLLYWRKLRPGAFEWLAKCPTTTSAQIDDRLMTVCTTWVPPVHVTTLLSACAQDCLDVWLREIRHNAGHDSHQRKTPGVFKDLAFHLGSYWGPGKGAVVGPREAHGVEGTVSSPAGCGFRPPRKWAWPTLQLQSSTQSATAFKISAPLEDSASEPNFQSSTIAILLSHSPDQAQSTLKSFGSQNSPSPPQQCSAQYIIWDVFIT